MKACHIVPPQWADKFPEARAGGMMITFVPWILKYPKYAEYVAERAAEDTYVILDTDMFERPGPPPDPLQILMVANLVKPAEIVLPDVLGESEETLNLSHAAMDILPEEYNVMFVPQARTFPEWQDTFWTWNNWWVSNNWGRTRRFVIGLSSLRQATGVKAQSGSRRQLIPEGHYYGATLHLLGLPNVREFLLESAMQGKGYRMRSVDTHIAFSTGARKQVLTADCTRRFLGDLTRYDTLPDGAEEVIRANFAIFDRWALHT